MLTHPPQPAALRMVPVPVIEHRQEDTIGESISTQAQTDRQTDCSRHCFNIHMLTSTAGVVSARRAFRPDRCRSVSPAVRRLPTVGSISFPLLLHLLQAQTGALVHVKGAEDFIDRLGVRVVHVSDTAGFPPPARCCPPGVGPELRTQIVLWIRERRRPLAVSWVSVAG